MPLADGRYLAREGEDADRESVLVVQTTGTPAAAVRRRRRPRASDPGAEIGPLPLVRVTAIRAFAPLEGEEEAERWLQEASEAEDTLDTLLADGAALLNRALHAHATAAADPQARIDVAPERAVAARIGYGSGEETAAGRFTAAREVDVRSVGSARRRRHEDLRPQERVAAVLGGREGIDACETLLLRARADLDAGREREAALQLRVGLQALLEELRGAVADPAHDQDFGTLEERRSEAGEAANAALYGNLTPQRIQVVRELLELCERILRRRRVLRG